MKPPIDRAVNRGYVLGCVVMTAMAMILILTENVVALLVGSVIGSYIAVRLQERIADRAEQEIEADLQREVRP